MSEAHLTQMDVVGRCDVNSWVGAFVSPSEGVSVLSLAIWANAVEDK